MSSGVLTRQVHARIVGGSVTTWEFPLCKLNHDIIVQYMYIQTDIIEQAPELIKIIET